MSYALMPYSVDLEMIRQFGSYDIEFADHTYERMPAYARNRLANDFDEDVVVEPVELLRQLLCGEPKLAGIGHRYAYALEAVCRTYGDDLPNAGWSGMRSEYFGTVASALSDIGVPFDPFELVVNGVPTSLPPAESGFPLVGSLELDRIAELAATFTAIELDCLADAGIRESVANIADWLDVCHVCGSGLVCFYY